VNKIINFMDRKALVASSSPPSDLDPQKKLKVSNILIESWTCWLATEVITSFQSRKTINIQVENAIQALELDRDCGFNKLSNELINNIQELEEEITSHEQLNIIREKLEVMYFDIVAPEVENLNQEFQTQSINLLKNLINVQFEQASPVSLMSFLPEMIHKLLPKRKKIATHKRWHEDREKSAWNAFYKLCQDKGSLQDKKSIWNAIKIALVSQLEAERYTHLGFVIIELMEVCRSYQRHVKASYDKLEQIKNSLKDSNPLNIVVSLPVFSLLDRVNVDEQEQLLEIWIGGHKLNNWGNAPADWIQIKKKLLSNLEPVVLLIFAEFETYFIEHLVT
jgi:hypothetical protein